VGVGMAGEERLPRIGREARGHVGIIGGFNVPR